MYKGCNEGVCKVYMHMVYARQSKCNARCRHHGTISLGALCVTTLVPGSIATVMHVVAPVPWDVTKECDHRQCIKTRHFGTTLYFSTIIVV